MALCAAAWSADLDLPWTDATVQIDATVDRGFRGLAGTIAVTSRDRFALVDPLATLPLPEDDRTRIRTYPGRIERGEVRFWPIDDHTWGFATRLPRRWEDLGTSGHGLFANGAWYPQPLFDGDLKVVDWNVRVQMPPNAAGAVGDVAGEGTLRWIGRGERASIAAVPRGRVTPIREDGVSLDLVTTGRPRHSLERELATEIPRARPPDATWRGAVVEAPLRRRLARPGIGLAYVSDRAFRVSPPLRRFHRVAVTRAVVASVLHVDIPEWRALAAAGLTDRYERALAGVPAERILHLGAFSPQIEGLLYDERLPFYSDVLERAYPSDPLRDDLVERYLPRDSAVATIAQLHDLDGERGVDGIWQAFTATGPAWHAFAEVGLSSRLGVLDRPPALAHAIDLTVDRATGAIRVTRDAIPGPPEAVVLAIDGDRTTVVMAPGDHVVRTVPGVAHVVVDPDQHLRLASRVGDRWPQRFSATASGGIFTIDPADATFVGDLLVSARRAGDTHVRYYAMAWADRTTLPGVQLGAAVQFGRAVDGLRHIQRVSVGVGPALLDPRYLPVDVTRRLAVESELTWRLDTRDEDIFPLHGVRLGAVLDGGVVPGTSESWASAKVSAIGVASPQPRWAFAGEVGAGLARGDVDHRLLALGGDGALLSVREADAIGTMRGTARGEARWAPIRGASVPLAVLWATELQLTAGLEAGWLRRAEGAASVVGGTAGIAAVGDWFGVDPEMIGVTAGLPVVCQGFACDRTMPQWTIRFAQAF